MFLNPGRGADRRNIDANRFASVGTAETSAMQAFETRWFRRYPVAGDTANR